MFSVWKQSGKERSLTAAKVWETTGRGWKFAMKTAHLCTNLMHDMTELMEESPHFIVSQERGPACYRLWEVNHQGGHRHHPAAIREKAAWLETKAGCMVVFSFPGRQKQRTVKWTLFFSKNMSWLLPGIMPYSTPEKAFTCLVHLLKNRPLHPMEKVKLNSDPAF